PIVVPRQDRACKRVSQPHAGIPSARSEIPVVFVQPKRDSLLEDLTDDVFAVDAAIAQSESASSLAPLFGPVVGLIHTGAYSGIQKPGWTHETELGLRDP